MQEHHLYHHTMDAIYEYMANHMQHPFVPVLMVMQEYFVLHNDHHAFVQ